jgi:hypothetical protein
VAALVITTPLPSGCPDTPCRDLQANRECRRDWKAVSRSQPAAMTTRLGRPGRCLFAEIHQDNIASQKLFEKFSFKLENQKDIWKTFYFQF